MKDIRIHLPASSANRHGQVPGARWHVHHTRQLTNILHAWMQIVRSTGFSRLHGIPPKGGTTNCLAATLRNVVTQSVGWRNHFVSTMAAVLAVLLALWASAAHGDELVLSTGDPSGTYFPLGEAIAEAVATCHPEIKIRVVQSAGSVENRARLLSGEVDLAFIQNDALPDANIRCLVPLHTELFHFFAATASDIDHVRQLVGKRVAIGPPDSGTRRLGNVLLQHYAVDADQLTVVDQPTDALKQLMEQGQLDAMFHVGDIQSALSRDLLLGGVARLVSFGEDQEWNNDIRAFSVSYPFIEAATMPRNLYVTPQGKGQPEEAIHTFGLRSLLVCRESLPRDVAHDLVAAIIRQRSAIMRRCPAGSQISESFLRPSLHFSLHDGAIQFYDRRKPGFLERYSETMAFILSAVAAFWALAIAAGKAITVKKKNRIDRYYARLSQISEQLTSVELTAEDVDQLDAELNRMRARALDELTREKLKADDSFRIFQALLTDCQRQVTVQSDRLGG